MPRTTMLPISIDQCVHHWMIDPPENEVSKGICRKCGQERNFLNNIDHSSDWHDQNTVQFPTDPVRRKANKEYAGSYTSFT